MRLHGSLGTYWFITTSASTPIQMMNQEQPKKKKEKRKLQKKPQKL